MIFKCCHGRCNLSILLATAWWRNSLLMPYSTSWWVKVTVKSCDIALGKQAINALLLLQVPATGSAFPSPTGSSYQQHLQQVSPGFPPAPPVVAWTERSDEALRRHQEEIYMSGLNYVEWLKVNNDAMIIGSFALRTPTQQPFSLLSLSQTFNWEPGLLSPFDCPWAQYIQILLTDLSTFP